MPAPLLFDAVLFDLDGTLVATDRFWVAAAGAGAERAFEELGLDRAPPSPAEWMQLVGLPLRQGLRELFGDLPAEAVARIEARCLEEEARALAAGGAAFLPHVERTLTELAERGVRLGIASNCGRDYLEHLCEALRLPRWFGELRCLDSPGIETKADMLADLLATFDTRSAVFVGDRRTDLEAARANAIPHVHLEGGFAPAREAVPADATVAHLGELVGTLERRSRWLDDVAGDLGLNASVRTLGVSGGPAAGKSLFARDLARVLRASGRPARALAADAFADPDELRRELLEPRCRGLAVELEHGPEADRPGEGVRIEPDELLVLEGRWLLEPATATRLDRLVHLELSDELAVARVAGRDGLLGGPAAVEDLVAVELPRQRSFQERYPPGRSDLVLDASLPLGPEPPPGP